MEDWQSRQRALRAQRQERHDEYLIELKEKPK
jgi:hypothetical protein